MEDPPTQDGAQKLKNFCLAFCLDGIPRLIHQHELLISLRSFLESESVCNLGLRQSAKKIDEVLQSPLQKRIYFFDSQGLACQDFDFFLKLLFFFFRESFL